MNSQFFHRYPQHSAQLPAELNPLTIISFSFITWLYQSTIHLACMGFKSDNLDDILTSVGSFSFWSCVDTWPDQQTSHYTYFEWMISPPSLLTNPMVWTYQWDSEVLSRHHSYFQHAASSMYHCLTL